MHFYLEELIDSENTNHTIARLELMRIISSLESYNQSHVFALLNIVFLDSPFLKKDLIRQGIFSFCQVYDVLKLNDLEINQDLQEEIINFLQKGGTSYSYIDNKRIAHRKGISVNGIPYNYQQDSQLLKEKTR